MVEVREEQTQVQGEQTEWVSGAAVERRLDLPVPSVDDKVAEGKDGWLFLANDSNDTLGQHAGERLLTDHPGPAVARPARGAVRLALSPGHSLRLHDRARCARCLLGHAARRESHPATTRPVLQVLDHLAERESWAPVLYPLEALRAEREQVVYPKTGSHWSEYGAFLGYRELMARLTETFPVRRLTRKELHLSAEQRAGDLGLKFDPPIRSRYVYVDVIDSHARLIHDNRVRNHGRLVEFEADAYNALTCLVFGDSYAVRVVPLLAESFQRTFWAHSYFDYELIRELRPDVVVSVVSERGMIVVQSDTEPGIRRLEAQKLAAGDLMEPRGTPAESLRDQQRASVQGEAPPRTGRVSEDLRAEELDLPASIRDGKVVEGRDGRLFLANDANHVLDQHSGRCASTRTSCASGAILLETRTAWLERRGSHHFFLIAPNAHSVYPDDAAGRCAERTRAAGPPAARQPARPRVLRAGRLSAGGACGAGRGRIPEDGQPLVAARSIDRLSGAGRGDPRCECPSTARRTDAFEFVDAQRRSSATSAPRCARR